LDSGAPLRSGSEIVLSYLLSLLIFVPLGGTPFVYLLTKINRRAGIYLAAGVTSATFLLALYSHWLVYASPPPPGQFALMERYTWFNFQFISLDYLLGLDGLSAPLVTVSSLLSILVIIGSRRLINQNEAGYYALLLLFEGSIMGVFTSLNLIVFYIFWELVLIPMFFFIGIWGGPRRKYAALKFILFTYTGSTVMLLGFLSVYFGFQYPSLY